MTTRRHLLMLLPAILAGADIRKLEGRWRTRISVARGGRRIFTQLRFAFDKEGGFTLEEFQPVGGQLAWVYRGKASLSDAEELMLKVETVTDPGGQPAEEGRTRYNAGESYNLGAVDFASTARIRVGGMEWLKELD